MRNNRNIHSTFFFATLITLTTPIFASATTGDIVKQFSTPADCPTGLTFDGKSLWLADRKSDMLYQIDTEDGRVIKTLQAPGYQVEGLTMQGDYLWALDIEQRAAFKLNTKSGIAEKTIYLPLRAPQGLAWDGKYLWAADYKKKDKLYRISAEDGSVIEEIPSPSNDPHGLTFDGKYLWVSDRTDDMIYMLWPENGYVILAFPSPSKFPRGLAFDGESLWNVDYQTDKIYQIKLRDNTTYVCTDAKKEVLEYTHKFQNHGPGEVTSLDIYMSVPKNLPCQKLLGDLAFDPEPTDWVIDKWGQKIAHFHYDKIGPGQSVTPSYQAKAQLYKTRFFIFPDQVGSLDDIPKEIKQSYLSDGRKYCINDPYIKKTADKIIADETNCYWIARKFFNYVIENMEYELTGGWNAAPLVLKRGTGSCSEYSFAFIALCRSVGLPARYVGSVVLRGDDASTDYDVFHRWAEVYLPNYGWVPFDLSRGDRRSPAEQAEAIGYRDNTYLITTIGGGDSEYLEYNYTSIDQWHSKGPCKINSIRVGEWSPLEENQK